MRSVRGQPASRRRAGQLFPAQGLLFLSLQFSVVCARPVGPEVRLNASSRKVTVLPTRNPETGKEVAADSQKQSRPRAAGPGTAPAGALEAEAYTVT
jgi:hypothetical protein